MDTNQQTIDAIQTALTRLAVTVDPIRTALELALPLFQAGYQSDQEAIAASVARQVGDVQAENETLKGQNAGLTGRLAEASSTIGTQAMQITALQTYKDNHPDL